MEVCVTLESANIGQLERMLSMLRHLSLQPGCRHLCTYIDQYSAVQSIKEALFPVGVSFHSQPVGRVDPFGDSFPLCVHFQCALLHPSSVSLFQFLSQ